MDTGDILFPHSTVIEVAWADMDAGGHVNNSVYFTYYETARIRYFEAAGLMDLFIGSAQFPMLVKTSCEYKAQVRYPDTVTVGSRIKSIGNRSFTMEYRVQSAKNGVAATGEAVVVLFSFKEKRAALIPGEVREAVLRFEGCEVETESESEFCVDRFG